MQISTYPWYVESMCSSNLFLEAKLHLHLWFSYIASAYTESEMGLGWGVEWGRRVGWGGVEVGGGVGPNNLPVGDVAVRREFLRTSAPLSRPPIHPAACGTQHSRVSTLTSLACHALHEAEPQTCCLCLPSHEAALLVCLECALLGDVT